MFRYLSAILLSTAITFSMGCKEKAQNDDTNNFSMADSAQTVAVRINSATNKVQVATLPDIVSQQKVDADTMKSLVASAEWIDVDSSAVIHYSDDVAKAKQNRFYFVQNPTQTINKLQAPANKATGYYYGGYYGNYGYYRPYGGYYNYSPAYGYTNWYWPGYSTGWYYPYSYWPSYYTNYNWWYYQPVSYYPYGGYNYYWYCRWW